MADEITHPADLGPARKCGTRYCTADPVLPREALVKDQLQFSNGKVATIQYACSCGEVRSMTKVPRGLPRSAT